MAAVTVSEMRDAEAIALTHGWTEESLLDRAGTRLGHALARFFPHPGTVVAYLGKGHNAGDALVAMAVLRDHYGWKIAARNAFPIDEFPPITRTKWRQFGLESSLGSTLETENLKYPLVLLDGLLGIGARGTMRAPLPALAAEMEWLRQSAGATVAAVDLPSGIDADTGAATQGTVTADVTFMIGNAKCGLLYGHAANFCGALALVPVEPLTVTAPGDIELISPQTMDFGKSPRPFDFHKGMAGHVGILAGSTSFTGAAVLAATGALRAGAGLITLFVPSKIHRLIASKCPPEVIVRAFSTANEWQSAKVDAWVIGCGLGTMATTVEEKSLLDFIDKVTQPTVIDADALNLIANSKTVELLKTNHLVTPHPGEFRRLAPDLADLPRELAARTFADRHPATLLLKGCRTLITRHRQPLWCNATGHPGMSTGGQGDLLAGVIGARLASGAAAMEAAAWSAWICGHAAECAVHCPETPQETPAPSDVARQLGLAHRAWKSARR
jgi:NAD(P)H-hydrate epimerase